MGIGLMLWADTFEETIPRRWCDADGQPIPTDAKGQAIERQDAKAAQQRADRLAERLREMGINPDEV